MRGKGLHFLFITFLSAVLFTGGAIAQGKHGKGKPGNGGGGGNGRGHEMKQAKQHGGDRADRGNAKAWQHQQRGAQQVFQQQRQQVVRQQRQQVDLARQQKRQQIEWARNQQRHRVDQARQQQRQNEWAARRQMVYQQRVERQRQQPVFVEKRRDDNAWVNVPRGNAYGRRGIWPGEFRGWRDPDKQARKAQKRFEKDLRRANAFNTYYQRPSYVSGYYYDPFFDAPRYHNPIVTIVASTVFGPSEVYYDSSYQPRVSRYYEPAYTTYSPASYYTRTSYIPSSVAYSYGDPYYTTPYYGGGQMFGGDNWKGALLTVGLSVLQGMLGNGYEEGLYAGQYARTQYGPRAIDHYEEYVPVQVADCSPYVSSLADQRQIYEEGYRRGYQDALADAGGYAANYEPYQNVDLVSGFLTNSLL